MIYIYTHTLYCIPLNASACHAQNQTLGKVRPFQESHNNVWGRADVDQAPGGCSSNPEVAQLGLRLFGRESSVSIPRQWSLSVSGNDYAPVSAMYFISLISKSALFVGSNS